MLWIKNSASQSFQNLNIEFHLFGGVADFFDLKIIDNIVKIQNLQSIARKNVFDIVRIIDRNGSDFFHILVRGKEVGCIDRC